MRLRMCLVDTANNPTALTPKPLSPRAAAAPADLVVGVEFGQCGERFRREQQCLFLFRNRGPDNVVADDNEDRAFEVHGVFADPHEYAGEKAFEFHQHLVDSAFVAAAQDGQQEINKVGPEVFLPVLIAATDQRRERLPCARSHAGCVCFFFGCA